MTPKEMGQVLRELRGNQPLWRMAAELEMSTENLRHYEAGRNRLVANDLPRFARAYGVTPEEFARRLEIIDAPEDDDVEAAKVREVLANPSFKILFARLFEDWEKASPEDRRMLISGINAAREAIRQSKDGNGDDKKPFADRGASPADANGRHSLVGLSSPAWTT